MHDVHVIGTSSLGDRSYLATDGTVAVVVDPQRDVDRVIALAGRLGVRITHVLETHIHNDYVSGGLELARLTGAVYGVAADDEVDFVRAPLCDGDVVKIAPDMQVRVLATPGHTFHHLSYVLEGDDGPREVFTGGSMLFGTTGRPDLLGQRHAETLARHQYASVHRLADRLPDGVRVWPTHGFGSFCSATQAQGDASTVGREKQINPALRLAEQEFVEQTLAGLDEYPAYYVHMGPTNAAGPAPVDLRAPVTADPAELARRIEAGEWVVDLRSRKAYVTAHLAGTVSLGLDGPMSTWLGWLIEWGAPITLIGETPDQVATAQRELVRIGIDRVAAAATTALESLAEQPERIGALTVASFADLTQALKGRTPADLPAPDVVLDVRMTGEWNDAHIEGATHVPLPHLRTRLGEIPSGTIWIHCGTGYRATTAASLLARSGRDVVLIDEAFSAAATAGIPIT